MRGFAVAVLAIWAASIFSQQAREGAPVLWRLDSVATIAGHSVTRLGSPQVVQTDRGPAVAFNGRTDGLMLDVNPLAGLAQFTVEVLFAPDMDGQAEQRFLHMQEATSENRALIELRQQQRGQWFLDTYLRYNEAQNTLQDRTLTHPAGDWHIATLTFDGKTMTHYVDGTRELSGEVAFRPLGAGRTSIGVRQTQISWFKGRIHTIRISPRVLAPGDFLSFSNLPEPPRTIPNLPEPSRVMPLWPEGVPDAKPDARGEQWVDGRVSNVHLPTLSYYQAAQGTANGTAVIVCPGGGYARLAMSNEPAGLTPLLTSRGVSVFVLKNRLLEYGHPAPLRDVLRAVRLVRSRAAEFGLRPDRIGLFGASAGGHLAASAATLFDSPEGRTGAALDAVSGRPDFVALQYPVVTMRPPHAHAGSRQSLLGANPPAALVERMSIETAVTKSTPPTFVVHTSEDTTVPIENSYLLVSALRAAGVPVESHFYERGAHGFGVSPGLGATSEWPNRLLEWMSAHGWVGDGAGRSGGPGGPGGSGRPGRPGGGVTWARGIEGQRKADLGNGYYRNPIVAGDHPDPSILKEGRDYYMTFSSFDAYPGLVIWHSRDLVNWRPIGSGALQECRVGVGARPRETRRALLHLLSGHRAVSIELRDLGRRHSRTVERSHRPQDRANRSGTRRWARWQTLPVLERWSQSAARCRRVVGDGRDGKGLRRLEIPRRLDRRGVCARGSEDSSEGRVLLHVIMHSYGIERPQAEPAHVGQTLHLRLRNDRHIVTIDYSVDGQKWERYDRGMEVSGYHHNVGYDFLSLRPALYAAGNGEVRFRDFRYRALPE